MKRTFHKIATYTALILISSLPFSVEVLADVEKKQSGMTFLSKAASAVDTKNELN